MTKKTRRNQKKRENKLAKNKYKGMNVCVREIVNCYAMGVGTYFQKGLSVLL